MFKVGDVVRVIANPDNIGAVISVKNRGNDIFYTVLINGERRVIREEQLELHVQEKDTERLRRRRIGNANNLRDHLTYIRISGNLDNMLYSMKTTNIDFLPYQYKPVLSFLDTPNNGLLIADEVGLGKTIEAGLIWTELRARFEYNRLMVVCPAVLRNKWEKELKNRFGVKPTIMGIQEVKTTFEEQMKGVNSDFAIITSMQGLRPRHGWRDDKSLNDKATNLARILQERADEVFPFIDLLIIDEAHYLRNPKSTTSQLGKLLRPFAENILLLSATPIHLKNNDLFQLLELIDEDTFNRKDIFIEILDANEPLVRAHSLVNSFNARKDSSKKRMKEIIVLLQQSIQHHLIKDNRQIRTLLNEIDESYDLKNKSNLIELAYRIQSVNLLSRVISRTRKREVQENRVIRRVHAPTVNTTEYEINFYQHVTQLVREYAGDNPQYQAFLAVMPQQQISSSMPAALMHWKKQQKSNYIFIQDEEEWDDILSTYGLEFNSHLQDIGPLTKYIMDNLDDDYDIDLLIQNDSKFKTFLDTINILLKNNINEKIIVFSFFKGTLNYIKKRLLDHNIESILIYGGMKNQEELIKQFEEKNGPNILLASDVASEGIDLQFASCMINYDLPWNPMKIEQRIGRIDRIGQQSKNIIIRNLFYNNTIDERIYDRLYTRLNIFQKSIGDFESILGEKIKELTTQLLDKKLTSEEEEERIEQTSLAIEKLRKESEELEEQADNLLAHGDYIKDQLNIMESSHRIINGNDIFHFVKSYIDMKYKGSEIILIDDKESLYDINLVENARRDLKWFIEEKATKKYITKLSSANRVKSRCRFVNKTIDTTNKNIEVINQFHPLVKFVDYKIKQEKEIYFSPIGIRLLKKDFNFLPKGYYLFSAYRMIFNGMRIREKLNLQLASYTDPYKTISKDLIEQLIIKASLIGTNIEDLSDGMDMNRAVDIINSLEEKFIFDFEKAEKQLQDENNDRADIQQNSLKMHLDNQLNKLEAVRQGHLNKGRMSLAKATETKIEIIKNNISWKIDHIEQKRKLESSHNKICIGIIEIF